MQIDIISDTVCPWCFIGKRKLERALAERPAITPDIAWRPFQLNPDMPAGGMDRKAYLEAKFGGKERARHIYQAIVDAGEAVGISFDFDKIRRTPSTLDSHRLIRWARSVDRQDAMVEVLFRRYFLDGENIGDHAVLIEAAREVGMDTELVADLLGKDADLDVVRREDEMARQMGVNGVPCFIVNRKYAVSGAQDPAIFHQVFDLAEKDAVTAEEALQGE